MFILEQIRYGLVGHRLPSHVENGLPQQQQPDTMEFETTTKVEYPHTYHKIHLSNIPDYIGGSLPVSLYALPITTPDESSLATFCNLRNPPRFPSFELFNNEYLGGLSTAAEMAKVLRLRLGEHDPREFNLEEFVLPMTSYSEWHQLHTPQPFGELLSRPKLETWLYRVFLKIAIPCPRDIVDFTMIYSPLNLTTFFRIIEHLHTISGYPAHWLSHVVSSILSGKIHTSARSPRSDPLTVKEVKTVFPALTQSTAPFAAQMSTLAAIWSGFLPFTILSPDIPPASTIRKYKVHFKDVMPCYGSSVLPVFILAFLDGRIMMPNDIRTYLLDDETVRHTASAKEKRARGLRIVDTW